MTGSSKTCPFLLAHQNLEGWSDNHVKVTGASVEGFFYYASLVKNGIWYKLFILLTR